MGRGTAIADVHRSSWWTLVDQAVSSGTNAAVSFAAASGLTAQAFGGYGLAATLGLTAVGIGRSVATDPLVVCYVTSPADPFRAARDAALSAVIACAVVLGLVVAGVAVLTGPGTRGPLLALAAVLPAVLAQDALRQAFFARRLAHLACACDVAWAGAAAVAIVALPVGTSPASWVILWGASAGVAAGITIALVAPRPRLSAAAPLRWWRAHRHLTTPSVAQFALANGSVQGVTVGTGVLAGVDAVGALRGAAVLLGPLGVLVQAMIFATAPQAAEVARSRPRGLSRSLVAPSILVAAVCAVTGLAAMCLPARLGEWALGDTWNSTRGVLVPQALVFGAFAAEAGAFVGLRTVGRMRAALRAQLVAAPLVLAAGLAGAALAGAGGALWGVAASRVLVLPLWWWPFIRRPAHLALPAVDPVAA